MICAFVKSMLFDLNHWWPWLAFKLLVAVFIKEHCSFAIFTKLRSNLYKATKGLNVIKFMILMSVQSKEA